MNADRSEEWDKKARQRTYLGQLDRGKAGIRYVDVPVRSEQSSSLQFAPLGASMFPSFVIAPIEFPPCVSRRGSGHFSLGMYQGSICTVRFGAGCDFNSKHWSL